MKLNPERIRMGADRVEKKTAWRGWIRFLGYQFLVYGFLRVLTGFWGMTYRPEPAAVSMLVVGNALWAGYEGGRTGRRVRNGMLGAWAGGCLIFGGALPDQASAFLNVLAGNGDGREDFTVLIMMAAAVIFVIVFLTAFVWKKGWIFYGITLPILFLGPLAGYAPDWLTVFLFAGFHMQDSGGRTGDRGAVRAAAAFLGVFLMASVLPQQNMEELLRLPLQMQQQVQARFGGERAADPGLISRGNLLLSGGEALKITVSRKPEQAMYLKNFTGGIYGDSRWTPADETDFYRQARLERGRYSGYYSWPRYFERRQYEWVRYGKWEEWQREGKVWDPVTYAEWEKEMAVMVEDLTGAGQYYQPYLSVFWGETQDGCQFSAYDLNEYFYYAGMENSGTAEWFRGMEEPYREYAAQTYLDTPQEGLSRLEALAAAHPDGDEGQITEWILQTLWSRAVYTRTPGFMPLGMDAAEYLLFGGGRGYCQHFATAAVLLYRMCGIPARYAAGYVAEQEDFVQQEDGSWQAVLTDESAHAWAEIYSRDYGWIPVEVTPPDSSSIPHAEESTEEAAAEISQTEAMPQAAEENAEPATAESGAGDDGREEEQAAEETGAATDEESGSSEEGQTGQDQQPQEDERQSGGNGARTLFFPGAGCAAAVSAGIIIRLYRKRHAGKKRRKKETPADAEFFRLVRLLHRCGMLMEFQGTESDFPGQLCRRFPSLREEDAAMAVHTAMKEGFSRERPSGEERRQARSFFKEACRELAAEAKGPRGLWLRLQLRSIQQDAPATRFVGFPERKRKTADRDRKEEERQDGSVQRNGVESAGTGKPGDPGKR